MIKVVILGPESTGKSTLSKMLAEHYQTLYCAEYAREYLMTNGKEYTYDDLLSIAKGQVAAEDAYTLQVQKLEAQDEGISAHQSILFVDTDMYVMKVWCEFVFGKCHPYILEQLVTRKYDLYLLCNIDLPWEQDELREYPDLETRERLYSIYRELLINQSVPWVEISGNYSQRLEKAVEAVDKLILWVQKQRY